MVLLGLRVEELEARFRGTLGLQFLKMEEMGWWSELVGDVCKGVEEKRLYFRGVPGRFS